MIPPRLVVLTFDDGERSHFTCAAPILEHHGFSATFFITAGLGFEDKERYVTWDEVQALHEAGFEIGNHTLAHRNVQTQSAAEFRADLEELECRFQEHGLPRAKTFCYPGYRVSREAVEVLAAQGYQFARRGIFPEYPRDKSGENGPAYDPETDHPLLVPTTGASGLRWTFEEFVAALNQARAGKIAVLCFHGLPGHHPQSGTQLEKFARFMDYLDAGGYAVIAMGDLAEYVDHTSGPADPFEPIQRRVGAALDAF